MRAIAIITARGGSKRIPKKNIKNFTGNDSGYEKPENPEIVLDTIHFTPQECAKVVYQEILKRIN